MMTKLDIVLFAFASFNAIRILAYFPQMAAIMRDANGATAVSYWTWSLFATSHISTVAYALVAVEDWQMAAVFAINALCCISIILLTAHKRHRCRLYGNSVGRTDVMSSRSSVANLTR